MLQRGSGRQALRKCARLLTPTRAARRLAACWSPALSHPSAALHGAELHTPTARRAVGLVAGTRRFSSGRPQFHDNREEVRPRYPRRHRLHRQHRVRVPLRALPGCSRGWQQAAQHEAEETQTTCSQIPETAVLDVTDAARLDEVVRSRAPSPISPGRRSSTRRYPSSRRARGTARTTSTSPARRRCSARRTTATTRRPSRRARSSCTSAATTRCRPTSPPFSR